MLTSREIAANFNVSIRTAQRWLKNSNIKKRHEKRQNYIKFPNSKSSLSLASCDTLLSDNATIYNKKYDKRQKNDTTNDIILQLLEQQNKLISLALEILNEIKNDIKSDKKATKNDIQQENIKTLKMAENMDIEAKKTPVLATQCDTTQKSDTIENLQERKREEKEEREKEKRKEKKSCIKEKKREKEKEKEEKEEKKKEALVLVENFGLQEISNSKGVDLKSYPEDFLEFYNSYPRRLTDSKAKAFKAYQKAIKNPKFNHNNLLLAVENYKKMKPVQEGFAKLISTFLNDEMHLEEHLLAKNVISYTSTKKEIEHQEYMEFLDKFIAGTL